MQLLGLRGWMYYPRFFASKKKIGYQAIDFGQMLGKYRKARDLLFGPTASLPL
jgi:hypothetical protein